MESIKGVLGTVSLVDNTNHTMSEEMKKEVEVQEEMPVESAPETTSEPVEETPVTE